MDDCKQVFALLSQYLDHDLPEGICEEISTHIEGCPPCVEFVSSLRRAVRLCRQYGYAELPGPLPEATRNRLLQTYRRMSASG